MPKDDFADQATNVTLGLIGLAFMGLFKLAGFANGWRDGECAVCHTKLRYNYKQHGNPPHYCPDCSEVRAADMFRRELIPRGWESSLVGNVQVHKDHSTMTFRGKGTNGETYRVSWDKFGNAHWTDEGVPENHPNRHRDPR